MAKSPESLELLFRQPYERTFDASLEATRQAGLKLIHHDAATGKISAEAGKAMNSWGEKVDLHVQRAVDGVRVRVVSTAKSFLGTNRHQKHLDAISKSLATILGPDALGVAEPTSTGVAASVALEGELARAVGTNGTVVLFENRVVISRPKTLLSAVAHGLKGDKEIRLTKIASVQLRQPGLLPGYIQFETSGGGTSQRGIQEAATDENTVGLVASQWDTFVKFKTAVDAAMDRAERPSAPAPAGMTAVEQLKQWKDLLDAGAITQEEFAIQKRKILG